jgi:predicted transcriptional regulator
LIRNAKEALQWRRSKVLELSSERRNQTQIAKVLQVSPATINSDMQYLRQQAKENIRKYIDEKLPLEYQKCLAGLDAILCRTWDQSQNQNQEEEINADSDQSDDSSSENNDDDD